MEGKHRPFSFTDDQWRVIYGELATTGRLDSGGERWELEFIGDIFVHSRKVAGKGRPTPRDAHKAWLRVAAAAQELHQAIEGLRNSGAADFSMIDAHSDRIKQWVAALASVERESRIAAEYEVHGVQPVSNNADPSRDHFLGQVITTWHGYGGKVRASTNETEGGAPTGPLVRFIAAVTEPILQHLGDRPPKVTLEIIRAAIKRHPAYGK